VSLPGRPATASKRSVLLRDAALVLVLNAVVALVMVLLSMVLVPKLSSAQVLHTLMIDMVFSQAIGFSILSLVEWPRLTWWWQRRPSLLGLGLVTAASVPIGYSVGCGIASALLSMPYRPVPSLDPAMSTVLLVTAVAAFVAVHLITQRDRVAAAQLRAENADVRASSARLQLLQQQIEPHMLFNTLANVHALIDTDPGRAQRLLEALSELLHASMQMSEQPLVPLQQEFALLRHYLQLMAMRMGPRLTFSLTLPPELEGVQLPPLSLQPLVENAVKHGLDPQVSGGSIHVTARRSGDRVIVDVVDDGQGLQVDDPFASGRIGLGNIRKRLACAFGDQADLQLADNVPNGVRATLTLPWSP